MFDSDLCYVRGLSPDASFPWSTALDPLMMVGYGIPADMDPEPASKDENLRWYLSAIPQAVESIAGWSAASGVAPDRDLLAEVLAKRATPFVEDVFFELLDAAGLPMPGDEGDNDESLLLLAE